MRQHIRILQRMALRLTEGNIDADVGIAPVTVRNALPDLLKLINIIHHIHAFYHKPA